MIYLVAAIFAGAFLCLLCIYLQAEGRHERERAGWREERRELLNRIQRPDRVPYTAEPVELPERTEEQVRNDRAWAQVGQVLSIDDSYGRD